MSNISEIIINLVLLAAVDLCQVPERVRRGEYQSVLLGQKHNFLERPSASRPSYKDALEKSSEKSCERKSGRDCRIASVFYGGYKKQFNFLYT